MFKKLNIHISDFNIVFVLLLSLLVRVVLAFFGTLHLDQGTFIAWSVNLATNGFKSFYTSWSDYLPGYMYILFLLGKVRGTLPDVLLYKLPAIISDTCAGYLIYSIVKNVKDSKWGLTAAGLYLFNPAVFANSALWGQVDGFTSLFSLLSIYLVPINIPLSAISLSLGTLIKPQAAFLLPVVIFWMLKNKMKLEDYLTFGLSGLTVFIVGFIPFWDKGNFFSFLLERLKISAGQYPYTSVNAFNFWGLIGFWRQDNPVYQIFGYMLVIVIFVILARKVRKTKYSQYFLATFIFGASFLFFTRMHERHLLPVLAPLSVLVGLVPSYLIVYVLLSVVYIANLYYSYHWITQNFISIFPDTLIKSFIVLGLASFIYFVWSWVSGKGLANFKLNFLPKEKLTKLPATGLSTRTKKILLVVVMGFAFVSRIYDLKLPTSEYFDEVYHAFTARLVLHGDPKAWEWWNPNPEGFAYEWTHPPLAKLGMVVGMSVFGENAFGWRVVQALLGTLSVYLVYRIAKRIFDDEVVGIISSAVFSLDGLVLVMSRIGMNDTYMLTFMLLSVYFFLKEKDFFSAIGFGLALASKWSAIWAIPILFVLWLRRKSKFRVGTFVPFLIMPIVIYLASYGPMFLTGHSLSTWWGVQQQMWWYHTGLRATHAYSSSWWSWPFLVRPIYLYTSDEVGGWVARIYAMGNPVVFWFGFASVIITSIYSFLERNRKLGIIIFSYLIFFVPWAASPRIMFLYHYLPSIPFLAIATGYLLRRNKSLVIPFFVFALVVFLYFYPHYIGMKVPIWLDTSYYWLPSWR